MLSKIISHIFSTRFGIAAICLTLVLELPAQQAPKKPLTVSDYGQWESLGFSRAFSDNGEWFFYDVRRNNDNNEIRLHHLSNGTVKVLPMAERAQFSKDSRWLAYFKAPSPKEKEKDKSAKTVFRLLNLQASDSTEFEGVSNFAFASDSRFIAMKQNTPKGKRGADLIIRNLDQGTTYNFGNVKEYTWQSEGSMLAMIIDADDQAGNGVLLFDSNTGVLKVLDSQKAYYSGLNWRKDEPDLAAFRSAKNESFEDSTQHIVAWKGLGTKRSTSYTLDQSEQGAFPSGNRIVNNRSMQWSDDGNSLYFYITHWSEKPEKKEKKDLDEPEVFDLTDEAPALQIWHSKDVQVIPEQQQLADRRREDQYLSVWHLDTDTFVQLANDQVETIQLQTDTNVLIGRDESPYEQAGMFGRGNVDIYTVNIRNGNRKKVLDKKSFVSSISPDGRFLPFIEGNDVFVTDLNSGVTANLTEDIDANFTNQDDDHPSPEKYPFGFVAWEASGKSFFVHSEYDIWQFWTAGKAPRQLTNGKEDRIRHRFSYIDFEDYIDENEVMYVSLFGSWSKKSGYGSLVPGKAMKTLIWEDARVTRLIKAEEADQFAFTQETFSDSPDYFVTSSGFADVKQLSETNPFQEEYYWGKSELIEYTNHDGKLLQGTLYYPANYDPSKKYPMITYIYEKLSDGLHGYGHPSQRNYYSHGVFTHEGYFVLRPDIVFDAGDPGIASTKTLEAAVSKVVEMGLVDEKRVGLVGHSWGGYQAGYVVTQTDIFAASVAGAGLTNLVSMYGMIAWAFGGAPESAHFEVSQERMEVPPYQDIEGYVRNSSVFNVDKLNTPLLFEVGDNDKNVDWRQGIEYYNMARRAGKQFVLLVYANEGHGLRQDKNRSDYQQRILKWFGHYLKGESAAPWIEQGVPYEEQMKILKNWKK